MTRIHAERLRYIADRIKRMSAFSPESVEYAKDLRAAAAALESKHRAWATAADERDHQTRRAIAAERERDALIAHLQDTHGETWHAAEVQS